MIGCDVGSQGTNTALYAVDGKLVASAYEGYDVSFPQPGWAEQDPLAWTRALHSTIARVLKSVPEGPSAVKALSFGSQLDGMVACDAKGKPLRAAMIWMDRRAEAQAAAIAEHVSRKDFYHHVGANLDSSHAVFKALWIRDEEPEVFARSAKLMSPGSYVLYEASGVVAVDYSNASSLALLDPRTRTWSRPILDATGIKSGMLPELAAGTQAVGPVTAAFAAATGLSPDTVVVVGCGDEMAATLGAGVFAPGEVCDVVGTAEPVCAVSAGPREDPTMLVECHPHADPDTWLLENPGFVSGGNLRWWRDQFCPEERAAEERGEGDAYDALTGPAAQVDAGAEGLIFLPCMQGRNTRPSAPGATSAAWAVTASYASPSPCASAARSSGQNWSRHHRRLPPETKPGFSSSQPSGSPWGWHSTSIVGSSRGSAETAHTGSAVPTTSHTSPGEKTPAPRVAAISSPQPTITAVSGDKPVAAANDAVTGPTD